MRNLFSTLLTVFIAFLITGGCGGGSGNSESDSCDFEISSVTNGESLTSVDSFWECGSEGVDNFEFAIFDNGTGFATNIGEFVWEETGCRSISILSGLGDAEAVNIDLTAGILTFVIESEIPGFEQIGFTCELNQFEDF